MMEHIKSAAASTKVVVKLPTTWAKRYGEFITQNAGAVGQVEGALRSVTYLIPGMISSILLVWKSVLIAE